MKRFLASKTDSEQFIIENGEHNHLKNVLRLKVDDKIICIINDEYDYICKITKIEKSFSICALLTKAKNLANPKKSVTVFQALTKKDNMNLIVQKLNELGVMHLYPFESKFTTAKDKLNKQHKLQEVAFQSSKQCERSISMLVHKSLNFNELLAKLSDYKTIIFANEKEVSNTLHSTFDNLKDNDNIALVIGSEGGFSMQEINALKNVNGLVSVSLGKRILRAETATIALCAVVLSAINEI